MELEHMLDNNMLVLDDYLDKDELNDLKSQDKKHFRADADKKSEDIKKEIDKRRANDK